MTYMRSKMSFSVVLIITLVILVGSASSPSIAGTAQIISGDFNIVKDASCFKTEKFYAESSCVELNVYDVIQKNTVLEYDYKIGIYERRWGAYRRKGEWVYKSKDDSSSTLFVNLTPGRKYYFKIYKHETQLYSVSGKYEIRICE